MDEGTDARDILENRLLPLRRGKIKVYNSIAFFYLIFVRLHRRCEPKPGGYRREERHQGGNGWRETIFSEPPILQVLSKFHRVVFFDILCVV